MSTDRQTGLKIILRGRKQFRVYSCDVTKSKNQEVNNLKSLSMCGRQAQKWKQSEVWL